MENVSDILGVGPALEFEGQKYYVKPLTFELRAKFEQWLRRRAKRAAQEDYAGRVLSQEDYFATLARIDRDWAAGVYAFGGDVSKEAIKTNPGLKEMLRLSLSKDHPEVDEAFIDRVFEANEILANQALAEANADPLLKTPPKTNSGAT